MDIWIHFNPAISLRDTGVRAIEHRGRASTSTATPGDFPWMTLHSAVGVHVSELGAHVDTLISTIEDKTLPLRLRLMATHWLAEVTKLKGICSG